jgi:predicted dehydrogenase
MAERVKIGFVGTGGMGQCAHLKNYAVLPDCEVAAIAEIRPRLAAQVAAKYGIPRVYADAEEMLANERLDGLVVPQPFDRHGQILPALYRHGLPVLTEKPLAASIPVGERMLEALKSGGSWHMVGYHKRSDPASQAARVEIDRLKQTGELGKLKYVRVTMPAGDWIANGFSDLIRSDEPMPPLDRDPPAPDMDADTYRQYVSFVNYYIHQVNLLRFLLGEPYRVTFADPSGVLFVAESETGVPGIIEMTHLRYSVDWEESALVAFEKGFVGLGLAAPLASNRPGRVEFFTDPGDGVQPRTTVPQLPWVHAMRQQAANFVAAIRGDRKPPCEAAEAVEDLRVARDYIRLWLGK